MASEALSQQRLDKLLRKQAKRFCKTRGRRINEIEEHLGLEVSVQEARPKKTRQTKSNVIKFKPKGGFSETGAKEFYKSWDWHDLRYKALLKHGRRCMCCGASPDTGAVMNVDHIKPIRLHWELRLEFDNLQVLCSPCNRGKSFRDQTDFRETQEPENELDREYKAILKS